MEGSLSHRATGRQTTRQSQPELPLDEEIHEHALHCTLKYCVHIRAAALHVATVARFQTFPRCFAFLFLLVVSITTTAIRAAEPETRPDSIAALQREIESILGRAASRTPGVAVTVVRREGPEWIAGLGMADIAAQKKVTADTFFRIGSTSKTLVALSVLKLEQEGRLRLDDTLKSRAPDLEFFNPWEETDPVRIVHLLEHTAGWDDIALKELAFNPAEEASLREGLSLRPATRTSRWRPGTRFSYSNLGPAAAAYAIEKITGQRFEDHVKETWFRPLDMKTASYFGTPEVRQQITQLHGSDGRTTYPYWKISVRPAGAINASARDMAGYIQFFLNRGAYGGAQLLPSSVIERMEHPTTTYAARDGLSAGYGLHLMMSVHDGRAWFGHNGGVMGGLTDFAYLRELGVGYCVMINSGNGRVLADIGRVVRRYLTRSMTPPPLPPPFILPSQVAKAYDGWYEPITPRQELGHFALRLVGMKKVTVGESGFTLQGLGKRKVFVATGPHTFRHANEAVATAALISDRSEGTLIEVGTATFRRLPPGVAPLQMASVVTILILAQSTLVFALVWVPRRFWGGLRTATHLRTRTLPLLSTLAGLALLVAIAATIPDPIERLGHPTVWSVSIFALSIAFPVLSFWSLFAAWRARHVPMPRLVWWHSFAAALALSTASAYLAYWGLAGWRSWV
jgi:CubicO group peptidase (beta-lactamase class C family)